MKTDIAIIGAGPIGIFGAFQAGMLGMQSCVIDALDSIGGQCSALYPEKPIYDIPAYPNILAQDLIGNLVIQAKPFKPNYLLSRQVTSLKRINDNSFIIGTSKGDAIKAKAVIIAAGAGAFDFKKPPLENIKSYEGKSVFYSVTKKDDFADNKILIAGGGDSALDWAISLSEIAEVTLLHRRDKFRAAPATVKKMRELVSNNKIKLVTGFQLHALDGDNGKLRQVSVSDLDGNIKNIETEILLPFFGLSQDLSVIESFGIEMKNHHIKADYPYFETNLEGVYAVGDVASYSGKLKLILTGFAEMASALHHAYGRVFDGKALHFEYSTTKGIHTAK